MNTLYSPPSYQAATAIERSAICNGCGTKGLPGLLVPDTLWGLSIEDACGIHDWMYGHGKTIEDKEKADRAFLNNMVRLVERQGGNKAVRWLRRSRAMKYYSAVRDFGGPAYWADKPDPGDA